MRWSIFILAALSVTFAGAEDRQPAKKAAAKKAAAPPAEVTVPAGATLTEPGTWTYTDAKGKKWIYRQTPFGIAKSEDKPAQPSATAVIPITAVEDGDKIRFERPGPFGVYRWEKKKSELSEDERAAWQRSKAKQE